MARRIKKNYVNNPDFYAALVEYQKKCKESEDSGELQPIVPRYIGECMQQIANRLSTKPNFYNYSFKDDMIMDGIENCLLYMHNFDPNKTQNPFAYFTQIIWNAFLRRIAKEKKQLYIKFASSQEMLSNGGTFGIGDEDLSPHMNVSPEYMNSFVEDFESKLIKNKKKKVIEELDIADSIADVIEQIIESKENFIDD